MSRQEMRDDEIQARFERIAKTVPAWRKLLAISEELSAQVRNDLRDGAFSADEEAVAIDQLERATTREQEAHLALHRIERVLDEEHIPYDEE